MSQFHVFKRAPGSPLLPASAFRFIAHFFANFKWWYLGMMLLESLNAACGILIPYAVSLIIKGVTVLQSGVDWRTALYFPLLLFIAFSCGEVLFGRMAGAIQIRVGPRQRQNVTRLVYHYLQHHSHRYLSNNFAGALAHRISEMAMGVSQVMWAIITEFLPMTIVFSVSVALLMRVNVLLGGFVACWAVFFVSASYWLATRCQPHALNAASARSETTGKIVDAIANFESVRLFARLGFERSYLEHYLRREMAAIRRSLNYAECVRWFQFSAAAVLKVGTLLYALMLWEQGQIGVADFVMAVSLSLLIINEARNLSRRFLEFFEYVGNVANGVHTIVQPHELIDESHARVEQIGNGAIEFHNLDFSYGNGKQLFHGLNVTIPPGQHVGLVGTSGSGKSTFVKLLLRTIEPQGGKICIAGIDISDLTQDALHSQLGLIPQDPTLFHRSLLENIRYGKIDASDEEVEAAARKAHAHDFIAAMPEAYGSMVGERGVKLSGGQRQRIAIARVLLKDAPILILDEATSSLDSITEQTIQDTLQDVMHQKTVIVVAHRLSTIAHMDRILVFSDGEIVEDGSHADLLQREGMYARLWSMQAGGFAEEVSP